MEYYTLKHAVDTKETGSVDRQITWKNPFKIDPNPLFEINRARDGEFPNDKLFPFNFLELNKGAKVTDLMSGPFYNGFIISQNYDRSLKRIIL